MTPQVFEDIHLQKPKYKQLELSLRILNIIFCVMFFLEMALKMIGLGLKKYLKNPWNLLDFVIVVVGSG